MYLRQQLQKHKQNPVSGEHLGVHPDCGTPHPMHEVDTGLRQATGHCDAYSVYPPYRCRVWAVIIGGCSEIVAYESMGYLLS